MTCHRVVEGQLEDVLYLEPHVIEFTRWVWFIPECDLHYLGF